MGSIDSRVTPKLKANRFLENRICDKGPVILQARYKLDCEGSPIQEMVALVYRKIL